ncbi:Glycerophosphoryl diester phosphodiesterase family-domain-containing protein [Xylariaceae sp. FL0662B]|nr:Glycerophosphoryl diester phosphodiesterase family-domain-containing protein [Xylariaceae sp. FL0662B]
MRFGLNLHCYIVPEWDGFYVDYNRLKRVVRNVPKGGDGLEGASQPCESIRDSLTRLRLFEHDTYFLLRERYAALLAHFSAVPEQGPASVLRGLDPDELHYVHLGLFELQQDLQKLQWFERVNHESVDRILAKLQKHRFERSADLDAVMSAWREMQQVHHHTRTHFVQELQVSLNEILRPIEPSRERLSFLLDGIADKYLAGHDLRPAFVNVVTHDSPDALEDILDQNRYLPQEFYQDLFKQLAIHKKWQCLSLLVSKFASILDQHCLVVLFCSIEQPSLPPSTTSRPESLAIQHESASRVVYELLTDAHETVAEVFSKTDSFGCSPLHYAVKRGFDICDSIRNFLGETKALAVLLETMLLADKQGVTPLHLATIGGHVSIVKSFIDVLPSRYMHTNSHEVNAVAGACLSISIRLRNDTLVKQLSTWADMKYRSAWGESAFHLAAQAGRCDYMSVLIDACASRDLSLDPVSSCGHTPLIDACAHGHLSVAELLLKSGANPLLTDDSGWTAKKHAVYRGHLAVAELFGELTTPLTRHLTDAKSGKPENAISTPTDAIIDYGSSKHTLVVNLGSMQLTRDQPPVQLGETSVEISPGCSDHGLFALELSVNGMNKQAQMVPLPLVDDPSSKPLVFLLGAESEPQLLVRLFKHNPADRTYPELLAAGAVFLHSIKSLCGDRRESLVREHTVLMLSRDSQEPIGSVLLTFIIAQPFGHLQTPISTSNETSRESGHIALIGHRGFGQNVADRNRLQLGENTIGSFLAAADHGATFVELDVQVTRDLQAVIYHDFSLSETGTDIPIHDVTADQYKYASHVQTPQGSPLITPDQGAVTVTRTKASRSRSLDRQDDLGAFLIRDRLKHTVDFKLKALKPNTRGDVIQEPLVTLPELFQKLPPNVGFNIEIKYPRIHETREAGVSPIALEINLFVDTILEQIHQFADQRPIILSSFTPEICILLSIKQKAYPVLFISNAGKLPANDLEKRVASVQAGVHFAKRWDLAGLCLASEPLLLCPELIEVIKSSGLLCASFGPLNSIPRIAQIQKEAGLDMIVVDKVALIAKALELK